MSRDATPSLRNAQIFDPWNTTATGHQRTENTYARTVSWREMRHEKLAKQFGEDAHCAVDNPQNRRGTHREQGSWEWVSKEEAHRQRLRREGMRDIRDFFTKSSKPTTSTNMTQQQHQQPSSTGEKREEELILYSSGTSTTPSSSSSSTVNPDASTGWRTKDEPPKKIFSNLTFYINGSTFPDISDHRLKFLISEHGGRIALHLSRKGVTHVILGRSHLQNSGVESSSQRLALAAGKIQNELARGSGGRSIASGAVRFVGVDW